MATPSYKERMKAARAAARAQREAERAVSLDDPWADTTTPHGRLVLTVLGGLAEFEHHLILSRTNEGRVRAKARGVRFGRKPKLTKHQQGSRKGKR